MTANTPKKKKKIAASEILNVQGVIQFVRKTHLKRNRQLSEL